MFGITAGVIRLLFSFNEWDMTQYLFYSWTNQSALFDVVAQLAQHRNSTNKTDGLKCFWTLFKLERKLPVSLSMLKNRQEM